LLPNTRRLFPRCWFLPLLAHFGKEGVPEAVVPEISQETLAEMVGTTRSRVSFFIHYNGALAVHSSLPNVSLATVH
jgi:CRP/FNR family transcriptional regulator, cyclic AMP receptor protein